MEEFIISLVLGIVISVGIAFVLFFIADLILYLMYGKEYVGMFFGREK